MNLVYCTTVLDHAMTGAGRFAQSVMRLKDLEQEFKVSVVSEDIENDPQRGFFRVPLMKDGGRPIGYRGKSQRYQETLKEVLTDQPADIIMFNNAWLGAHWVQKKGSIPVIAAIRDDNAIYPFSNAIRAIPGLRQRRSLEKKAVHKLDHIVTNSNYMAHQLNARYGVAKQHISVIPPAYAQYASTSQTARPINTSEPIKILFAKNDYKRGGFGLLVKALETMTQYQFELTVAGPEQHVIQDKFEACISKVEHIQWNILGRVYDYDRMLEVMSEHHIFCMPSKREAFGVANIEALSKGLRVVYHQVGGVPSELRQFGYPIEKLSWRAIRTALNESIHMKTETVQKRVEEGKIWIRETYSPDKMLTEFSAVLSGLYSATSKPISRTA